MSSLPKELASYAELGRVVNLVATDDGAEFPPVAIERYAPPTTRGEQLVVMGKAFDYLYKFKLRTWERPPSPGGFLESDLLGWHVRQCDTPNPNPQALMQLVERLVYTEYRVFNGEESLEWYANDLLVASHEELIKINANVQANAWIVAPACKDAIEYIKQHCRNAKIKNASVSDVVREQIVRWFAYSVHEQIARENARFRRAVDDIVSDDSGRVFHFSFPSISIGAYHAPSNRHEKLLMLAHALSFFYPAELSRAASYDLPENDGNLRRRIKDCEEPQRKPAADSLLRDVIVYVEQYLLKDEESLKKYAASVRGSSYVAVANIGAGSSHVSAASVNAKEFIIQHLRSTEEVKTTAQSVLLDQIVRWIADQTAQEDSIELPLPDERIERAINDATQFTSSAFPALDIGRYRRPSDRNEALLMLSCAVRYVFDCKFPDPSRLRLRQSQADRTLWICTGECRKSNSTPGAENQLRGAIIMTQQCVLEGERSLDKYAAKLRGDSFRAVGAIGGQLSNPSEASLHAKEFIIKHLSKAETVPVNMERVLLEQLIRWIAHMTAQQAEKDDASRGSGARSSSRSLEHSNVLEPKLSARTMNRYAI